MTSRSNQPLPEQWHEAAIRHADAVQGAQMRVEGKTSFLAQLKMRMIGEDPKLSDARAETLVKASDEWRNYIKEMVLATTKANKLGIEKDFLKMKFSQWISEDANHRMGAKIG